MGENPLVNPYLGPVLVSPMPPEVLKKQNTGFNIFLLVPCGALFGIIFALLVPTYLNWVESTASHMKLIVQAGLLGDMAYDYTVALIIAILIGLSIIIWPVQKQDKIHILWMWITKVFITLGFMLVYEK